MDLTTQMQRVQLQDALPIGIVIATVIPPPSQRLVSILALEIFQLYGQVIDGRSRLERHILARINRCTINEPTDLDYYIQTESRNRLEYISSHILIKEREYTRQNQGCSFLVDLFNCQLSHPQMVKWRQDIKKAVQIEIKERHTFIQNLFSEIIQETRKQEIAITQGIIYLTEEQFKTHIDRYTAAIIHKQEEYKEKTGGRTYYEDYVAASL